MNLKELVNKQVKYNKYKQIMSGIAFVTTLSLNLFLTLTENKNIDNYVNAILVAITLIVSLIIIPSFVASIMFLVKLHRNAKLINELVKEDSRNNYMQDDNSWKEEFCKKKDNKNKKISTILLLVGFLSILLFSLFLILSFINSSWVKDDIEVKPLDIINIVFTILFGISSIILIILGFVFKAKLKEYEIQGYLIINERNENLYYKDIKLNLTSLTSFNVLELPNKEKIVYISGTLIPYNLIEKETEKTLL